MDIRGSEKVGSTALKKTTPCEALQKHCNLIHSNKYNLKLTWKVIHIDVSEKRFHHDQCCTQCIWITCARV